MTLYTYTCVYSMEDQLADFERRHVINRRWAQTDKEYLDARQGFLCEKREQIHTALWSTIIRRHYLLRMKAKYSGKCINIIQTPLNV